MSARWDPVVCLGTFLRVSRPVPAGVDYLDLWCLHGAGESGIPFYPLLGSDVARLHRIVVPDLPGFGASPPFDSGAVTYESMVAHLAQLVATFSERRRIAFIGHSIGAMIATELTGRFGEQVHALISVEGNLTSADAYLTGLAAAYTDPIAHRQAWLDRIGAEAAAGEPGAAGLVASLHFADPMSLWNLARTAAARSSVDQAGAAFADAACPKHYYYGDRSLSSAARDFLSVQHFHVRSFPGCGHWPMVEAPDAFQQAILLDLSEAAPW